MKLELWVYKWLLQAYPKEFRLEFGHEMLQVFKLELKHAKLERRTLMFWVSAFIDCVWGGTRERFFRKGENMNWLRKLGAISSFLFAVEILASIILRLLQSNFLTSLTYFDLETKILPSVHRGLFALLGIGIILALPAKKNRVELFGIGAFSIGWMYCAVILLSYSPDDPNLNMTVIGIFSALLTIGIFAMIFARVKFVQGKITWSELPPVARALIVLTLCNWLLPNALVVLFTWNTYSNLMATINVIGWMALGFGIWNSKPLKPSTPNLIPS
jgi:hypothetical protein